MITNDYSEAAVEVLDILDNTTKEDVQKIPQSFIKYMVNIASIDYKVSFDHSKALSELNLSNKTKDLLGYININWWSNEKERKLAMEKVKKINNKRQEELRKKYDIDNLFKNNESNEIRKNTFEKENLELVKYKENLFKKVLKNIVNFFKKEDI